MGTPMRLDPLARLRRANPWWQGAGWEQKDHHLAALPKAPFTYNPRPLDGVVPGNVYTLLGPRRVGKSTAVKSIIRTLLAGGYPARRVVYYSCDLLGDAQELAAFLERIYDEAKPDGALAGEASPSTSSSTRSRRCAAGSRRSNTSTTSIASGKTVSCSPAPPRATCESGASSSPAGAGGPSIATGDCCR
jgi:hypothetical protein